MVLYQLKLASSRTHAQTLIREGSVEIQTAKGWEIATKPSLLVEPSTDLLRVRPNPWSQYVSRGGLKLEEALAYLKLDVQGLKVLDVGISTGGFSDCLLQKGAGEIVGVDVGHSQLHPSLQSKVQLYEGVNARHLGSFKPLAQERFDLIVVDVSFISLRLILPQLTPKLLPHGRVLALVKPQFELGPASLNKKGIVKDATEYAKLRDQVLAWCEQLGLSQLNFFASHIKGSDGNQEFFVFAVLDGSTPHSG